MIAPSLAWKRYALLSATLVLIPLPLTLLLRAGVYGVSAALLATVSWLALLLYWWPLGALHLFLPGKALTRWVVGFLASVPLFFVALWFVYFGIGSRMAPDGLGGWAIYLSNTPWYFLGTWALSRISAGEGRAWHVILSAAVLLLIVTSLGAVTFAASQDRYRWPAAGPERWRIVNVRLVDPAVGLVLEGQHVIVERDRIVAVVPASADTSHATALDAGGRYLVPGLIDAHAHLQVPIEGGTLAFRPSLFFGSLVTRFAPNRRAYLEAGVTTIRDIGGAAALSHTLRDAIERRELLGPRMLTVGRMVTSPDGHPAGTIWTRELRREGAIEARDSATMIAALEQDLAALRPDGVKLIYGTIGRAPTRLDPHLLRIASAWARSKGLWVAIHAETADEVLTAATAVATTIEHAGSIESLPDSLMSAIIGHKPWLDPTLGEWLKAMELSRRDSASIRTGLGERLARMRLLRTAGARFIVGTDAPLLPYGGGLHDELALLRQAGFSPAELLHMATVSNAEALGLSQEVGALQAGYSADFILVEGNPLENLDALRKPVWVVRGGTLVVGGLLQPQ